METKTTIEINNDLAHSEDLSEKECYALAECKWVKVDDIIKYLNQYKKDIDDYHSADYFVKKFIDELSQSNDKELK